MAVESGLLRALAGLRLVVLVNSLVLGLLHLSGSRHPLGVVVCLLVMTAWTGVAIVLYARPERRGALLLLADLAVALGLLLATPLVKGPAFESTVPGFWLMGALFAWAVHYRLPGGLVAGVLLASLDLGLRQDWTQSNYGNAFLLLLGGPVVGYLSASLQEMADQRDRAERAAASASERARLARAVHDGVLQVLAMVQRRGAELGDGGAELGRLAGEQETTLRALIRAQDSVGTAEAGATGVPGEQVDLADRLGRLAVRPGVEVATPGTAVPIAAPLAAELLAVVVACLDNVERHVGADARAWVLLEDLGDALEISVRDDGPGIVEGRLVEAEQQGRLGVCESIRGRVRDLGGTVTLDTGSYGTEWAVVVPRERA